MRVDRSPILGNPPQTKHGVQLLVKLGKSGRLHIGVSALILVLLFNSFSVLQISSASNLQVAYAGEVESNQVGVSDPAKIVALVPPQNVTLPGEKLTVSLAAKATQAKTAARKLSAARVARERTRRANISRNYTRPVSSYRLSAGFGDRSRLWSTGHSGQDFVAPYGTPVRAAEAGSIVSAGWDGPYGWKIAIAHINGIQTWYGHLSRINVKVGQRVKVGQLIGRIGASGHVTGAHLHFEVQRYGKAINPVKWLRTMGIRV